MCELEVKICGITREEDFKICIESGIDCIGFIYYEKSKRFINFEDSARINSLSDSISSAGVFVDSPLEFIIEGVNKVGLDIVQLHGKESIPFILKLKKSLNDVKIIKCLYFDSSPSVSLIDEYNSCCDAFLIEGEKERLPGGNGLSWNYSRLKDFSDNYPLIAAGGLNADNLVMAVEKSMVKAVDLSSGVEISPGIKDHEKIIEIGIIKKEIKFKDKLRRIFK